MMVPDTYYTAYCNLTAGEKGNAELEYKESMLDEYDILEIDYIDIMFYAEFSGSFECVETGTCRIISDDPSNISNYLSGKTIYEKDGIKVDYLKKSGNNYTFALTNTSGNYFSLFVKNLSINGHANNSLEYSQIDELVLNNSQWVFTMEISDDFLARNNITSIEEIEFALLIEPLGVYNDRYYTDSMKLTL